MGRGGTLRAFPRLDGGGSGCGGNRVRPAEPTPSPRTYLARNRNDRSAPGARGPSLPARSVPRVPHDGARRGLGVHAATRSRGAGRTAPTIGKSRDTRWPRAVHCSPADVAHDVPENACRAAAALGRRGTLDPPCDPAQEGGCPTGLAGGNRREGRSIPAGRRTRVGTRAHRCPGHERRARRSRYHARGHAPPASARRATLGAARRHTVPRRLALGQLSVHAHVRGGNQHWQIDTDLDALDPELRRPVRWRADRVADAIARLHGGGGRARLLHRRQAEGGRRASGGFRRRAGLRARPDGRRGPDGARADRLRGQSPISRVGAPLPHARARLRRTPLDRSRRKPTRALSTLVAMARWPVPIARRRNRRTPVDRQDDRRPCVGPRRRARRPRQVAARLRHLRRSRARTNGVRHPWTTRDPHRRARREHRFSFQRSWTCSEQERSRPTGGIRSFR